MDKMYSVQRSKAVLSLHDKVDWVLVCGSSPEQHRQLHAFASALPCLSQRQEEEEGCRQLSWKQSSLQNGSICQECASPSRFLPASIFSQLRICLRPESTRVWSEPISGILCCTQRSSHPPHTSSDVASTVYLAICSSASSPSLPHQMSPFYLLSVCRSRTGSPGRPLPATEQPN